jgi:hypothetical protein
MDFDSILAGFESKQKVLLLLKNLLGYIISKTVIILISKTLNRKTDKL